MFKQKNAQAGETISWLVATVIIFVMMMFFVFGASLLGNTKKILQYKEKAFEASDEMEYSFSNQKSVYAYSTSDNPTLKPKIRDYVLNQSYDFDKKYEELKKVIGS